MTSHDSFDDEDGRLPPGVRRVGYDSDTQTYTFQDEHGRFYEGEEGARYGPLLPVGVQRAPMTVEEANALRESNRQSWRMMLPFFLIVCVFLLVVFRFLGPSLHGGGGGEPDVACRGASEVYRVRKGDTCWQIAERFGTDVKGLRKLNPGIECDRLGVGGRVCVPRLE